MKHNKGFTLIELLVVVLVIAILSAIVLPNYSDYVRRGKISEATTTLSGLRVAMEQFFQDNRTYFDAVGACGVGATPPRGQNFTYACAPGVGQTYTITATGVGSMNGFDYTIDQSNARASAIAAALAPWTNPVPNNCWTTKPGGLC